MFTIGKRLAARPHRQKWTCVTESGVSFQLPTEDRLAMPVPATVRGALEHASPGACDAYLTQDFSQWIEDVFGDYALAEELRAKRSTRPGWTPTPCRDGQRRSARYDLTEDEVT
jgi:hypothetical protein